jgi:hypothetical protein
MRFAGGTLENFWQMSARDYDDRAQELTCASGRLWNSCRRTRSKPKQTAKIFSAGSETIKATVIFVRNKPRQPACRQGAVKS